MTTEETHPDVMLGGRGGYSDPTHRLLAGISWNLAVLANEVKRVADTAEERTVDFRDLIAEVTRVADVLEEQTKVGGAFNRGPR